ncbi:MAG: orotate phosphoribosyltransferase [Gracilibacteraceae bacterium]|jgi:orotate phosphoribosyltransferase|nr:orotate phosphoribosyltransferase [Gracilibacteraceae bacterium]
MAEQEYKKDFIVFMVRAGVLLFGDFVTKSGRRTPYFINTGNYRRGGQIARLGGFYASCVEENTAAGLMPTPSVLFGPAYKGIPLAVATSIALAERGMNVGYCFNRKEEKDHGEGGNMVGYPLKAGDRVLITEDVITAGTAVRECLPLLRRLAVKVVGLMVAVDRMERGTGELSAIHELESEEGVKTFPVVSVRDIIECLHNRPVDGTVLMDDEARERLENYLARYGPR